MSVGTAIADDRPVECSGLRALIKTGGYLLDHPPSWRPDAGRRGADQHGRALHVGICGGHYVTE